MRNTYTNNSGWSGWSILVKKKSVIISYIRCRPIQGSLGSSHICSFFKIFLFLKSYYKIKLVTASTKLSIYLNNKQLLSFTYHKIHHLKYTMEKAMATHSSILAWKIPWTEEPSGLQSMGSLRVRHDWVTPVSLFTFMHWRRKWQPTPVFLPGESQGWGRLVGCRLWGRTESDITEAT